MRKGTRWGVEVEGEKNEKKLPRRKSLFRFLSLFSIFFSSSLSALFRARARARSRDTGAHAPSLSRARVFGLLRERRRERERERERDGSGRVDVGRCDMPLDDFCSVSSPFFSLPPAPPFSLSLSSHSRKQRR